MKLFLLAGALLSGSVASLAGPCVPGTLQTYIDLGSSGCDLGLVTFGSFQTAPGQNLATPIGPSAVQVSPGGTPFAPSLTFTLNQTANATDLFESFFRFQATGPLAWDAITLNNPSATGDGVVTATEDICPDANFSGNAPQGCPASQSLVAFATADLAALSDSKTFPVSSFFDIFVDLTVDGGIDGTAVLPSATVQLSAVPEPSSVFLVLAGLGAIGLARRQRRNP